MSERGSVSMCTDNFRIISGGSEVLDIHDFSLLLCPRTAITEWLRWGRALENMCIYFTCICSSLEKSLLVFLSFLCKKLRWAVSVYTEESG